MLLKAVSFDLPLDLSMVGLNISDQYLTWQSF